MMSRRGLFHCIGSALFVLGLSACSDPSGLDLIPAATVSCEGEEPLSAQKLASASMLPGRVCGACHRAGGQAANSPWTVSGTVYATKDGPCNTGGQAGITVEIAYAKDDPKGQYFVDQVQPGGLLKTNESGNFYSTARFVSPMKVRIFSGTPENPGRQAQMVKLVGIDDSGAPTTVDCNACHYPNSPQLPGNTYGRIYLE
jgi:hypothetical protein